MTRQKFCTSHLVIFIFNFTLISSQLTNTDVTGQVECGKTDESDKTDIRKQVPWIVSVFQRDKSDTDWEYVSPGVILGPTTILTTCRLGRMINGKFRMNINASQFHVMAGAETLDENSQDEFSQKLQVSYIQLNPKYLGKTYDFCSTLLHLKDPLNLNTVYVKPICLPIFLSNKTTFGYAGPVILTNFAEKANSDGFAHLNIKRARLTSQEFCFAHTYRWNTYCGVVQPGGENIVDICMSHLTVSATQQLDKRWYLLGFGSSYNNEVCTVRKLEDKGKLSWIMAGINCGPSRFPCAEKCISLDMVCDGYKDCDKNEDENPQMCRARNPCVNDLTFQCGIYENCIKASQVCDGFPDCFDSADENPILCKNTKRKNVVPFYMSTTEKDGDMPTPQMTTIPPISTTNKIDFDVQETTSMDPMPSIDPRVAITKASEKFCSLPIVNEGTVLTCKSKNGESMQNCSGQMNVGSVITFKCKSFYKPAISSQETLIKKCSPDSRWRPDRYFECVPDCGKVVTSNAYIVNGQNTNEKDRFPWNAAIFVKVTNNYDYICGATLIRQSFLVTAAHCVTVMNSLHSRQVQDFKIALAPTSSNFETILKDPNVEILDVRTILVNEHYDPMSNYQSDIAIIGLAKSPTLGVNVMMACLATEDLGDTPPGTMGRVAGFGLDETGNVSESLQFANLPIINTEDCIKGVHFIPSVNQFCAGYTNGTGVCFGDSGSGFTVLDPISQRFYLHGITSVGPSLERKRSLHCNHNTYSVFTAVNRFVEWINQQINIMEMEL